jgi:hypothetical protein
MAIVFCCIIIIVCKSWISRLTFSFWKMNSLRSDNSSSGFCSNEELLSLCICIVQEPLCASFFAAIGLGLFDNAREESFWTKGAG